MKTIILLMVVFVGDVFADDWQTQRLLQEQNRILKEQTDIMERREIRERGDRAQEWFDRYNRDFDEGWDRFIEGQIRQNEENQSWEDEEDYDNEEF